MHLCFFAAQRMLNLVLCQCGVWGRLAGGRGRESSSRAFHYFLCPCQRFADGRRRRGAGQAEHHTKSTD
uniref:Putative secreted protein n=1 Tax=Anopheles darlingi TaxID=43151 RepID=A0A2M4DF48_ANODA